MSRGACWGWDCRVGAPQCGSRHVISAVRRCPHLIARYRARRRLKAARPCTWQYRYLCLVRLGWLYWQQVQVMDVLYCGPGGCAGSGAVRRLLSLRDGDRQQQRRAGWSSKEKESYPRECRAGQGRVRGAGLETDDKDVERFRHGPALPLAAPVQEPGIKGQARELVFGNVTHDAGQAQVLPVRTVLYQLARH